MSIDTATPASCGACILRTHATNLACVRCTTERLIAPVAGPSGRGGAVAIALLVITAACWGSAFHFTALALAELPPLEVTFLRCLIGAVVICCATAIQQGRRRDLAPAQPLASQPSRRAAWRALVVGGTCTGIAYATIAFGQVGATSTTTGVILGTVPVWTAMFVLMAGRGGSRRPPARLVVALLLGSGAAAVPAMSDPAAAPAWAVALLALAAVSHGASMAVIQPAVERFGPLRSTIGVNVASALLAAPWVVAHARFDLPSGQVLAAVLFLGVLPTGLAYVTFFEVARRLGARSAALAVYLIPAVALTVGWISDPKLVTGATLTGVAFGISAVLIGVRSPPGTRHARRVRDASPARAHRPSPG